MSSKELRRAGVLTRVESGELKLSQRRRDDGDELSREQALSQALSQRGSARAAAWKRRAGVEPKEAEEISGASVAVGGQEVFRGARRAVRTDVGGGAPGERRWCGSECADAAALDVVGRAMESGAKAPDAPQAARAERACGRVGADGWKFPRGAGGTGAAWALDEHDGRCQRRHAGTPGE